MLKFEQGLQPVLGLHERVDSRHAAASSGRSAATHSSAHLVAPIRSRNALSFLLRLGMRRLALLERDGPEVLVVR